MSQCTEWKKSRDDETFCGLTNLFRTGRERRGSAGLAGDKKVLEMLVAVKKHLGRGESYCAQVSARASSLSYHSSRYTAFM